MTSRRSVSITTRTLAKCGIPGDLRSVLARGPVQRLDGLNVVPVQPHLPLPLLVAGRHQGRVLLRVSQAEGVAQLVGRHQQQPRPVLARHLLQLPVLVIVKVCVPPVPGEERVSSLTARTIKPSPVTVIASLKPGEGGGTLIFMYNAFLIPRYLMSM